MSCNAFDRIIPLSIVPLSCNTFEWYTLSELESDIGLVSDDDLVSESELVSDSEIHN